VALDGMTEIGDEHREVDDQHAQLVG